MLITLNLPYPFLTYIIILDLNTHTHTHTLPHNIQLTLTVCVTSFLQVIPLVKAVHNLSDEVNRVANLIDLQMIGFNASQGILTGYSIALDSAFGIAGITNYSYMFPN